MLQETKNEIGKKMILIIIQFLINYIKYFFLTGSVIFSITILLFIILNIDPNFSFGFFQYFQFINPIYATGTFNMGIKEIMEIFSVVSLVLMIVASLIKMTLKKIFDLRVLIPFRLKIIIFFIAITFAYILASIIVAYSDKLDTGFYFVFIIFYILNLISATFYFLFDMLSKKIAQIFEKEPCL